MQRPRLPSRKPSKREGFGLDNLALPWYTLASDRNRNPNRSHYHESPLNARRRDLPSLWRRVRPLHALRARPRVIPAPSPRTRSTTHYRKPQAMPNKVDHAYLAHDARADATMAKREARAATVTTARVYWIAWREAMVQARRMRARSARRTN